MPFIKGIIIFILAILLLTGCAFPAGKDAVILYDLPNEPASLDPQIATDEAALVAIYSMFEGLMRINSSGELDKGVITAYEVSENGLIYTFHLKKDLIWCNRQISEAVKNKEEPEISYPLTADDFVFAFERLADPETKSSYQSFFTSVLNFGEIASGDMSMRMLGVKALDNYTLEIQLKRQNPFFLKQLTISAAMPCNRKFFDDTKGKYGLEASKTLSNGAFYLRRWEHDFAITLERNPIYTTQTVYPNLITLGIIPDYNERLIRFTSGKTDLYPVSGKQSEKLEQDGYKSTSQDNTTWALVFNGKKNALANKNIRQGLSVSIDKSRFKSELPGYIYNANAIIPPAVNIGNTPFRLLFGDGKAPGFSQGVSKDAFNLGLMELGLNKLPRSTLLVPDSHPHIQAAGYIQSMWQENISVFINLEALSEDEIKARVLKGDYDIAIIPIKPDYDSPLSVLSRFTSRSPSNFLGYENEEYDNLIADALSAGNLDDAGSYMQRCEGILMRDYAVFPLYYERTFFAIQKGVSGITPSAFIGQISFTGALKR